MTTELRETINRLERSELKLLAEMDELRAALTEREERIAAQAKEIEALRALVDNYENLSNEEMFTDDGHARWELRRKELLTAAGRSEGRGGTWERP